MYDAFTMIRQGALLRRSCFSYPVSTSSVKNTCTESDGDPAVKKRHRTNEGVARDYTHETARYRNKEPLAPPLAWLSELLSIDTCAHTTAKSGRRYLKHGKRAFTSKITPAAHVVCSGTRVPAKHDWALFRNGRRSRSDPRGSSGFVPSAGTAARGQHRRGA